MAINKNNSVDEALLKLKSEELEKVVIGSFLSDSSEDTQKYINTLVPEAFTHPDYRTLFSHIKSMRNGEQPIDIMTLYSELLKAYSQEESMRLNMVVLECTGEIASTIHIEKHTEILIDYYQRRELVKQSYKSMSAYGDTSVPLADTLKEEQERKELLQTERGAKYSHLLKVTSEEERLERMRNRQGDLNTEYEFTLPNGDKERLTLPSGALTFVCAATSHGKSTLLQNLALQIAQTPEDGDTLYFTFEEDDDSVYMQLLNKYIGVALNRGKDNNLRTIADFYQRGKDFVGGAVYEHFHKKRAEFNSLLNSGKLRLYYEDYDNSELVDAIKEIVRLLRNRGGKLKAIFIDYIQLLTIRGYKNQRREELRDIAQALRTLAISLQIPIVVAAQLNRETHSPLDLCNENIAEAADLEREANKIICIWNSSFEPRKSEKSQKSIEEFEVRTNITLGTEGKIYTRLTKNRGSVRGIEAVLNYNGNTGVIEPNYKEEPVVEERSIPRKDEPVEF